MWEAVWKKFSPPQQEVELWLQNVSYAKCTETWGLRITPTAASVQCSTFLLPASSSHFNIWYTHIYIYTVYIGIEFFIKLHPNSFCVCLFCLLGILLPTTQADILLLRAEDKTTRLCLLAVTLLCMKVLRHAWWNYAKRWVTGLSFALNWILMRITWSNMVRYFLLPC